MHERRLAVRFPLALAGAAEVREWWDETAERFRIEVRVTNPWFGPLFGYSGSFAVVEHPCATADIPLEVRPVREEQRE